MNPADVMAGRSQGNARAEMTKVISQMSLKMRNVLTTEQWQQLRERQEERMIRAYGLVGVIAYVGREVLRRQLAEAELATGRLVHNFVQLRRDLGDRDVPTLCRRGFEHQSAHDALDAAVT